jgi:hypothetical protein
MRLGYVGILVAALAMTPPLALAASVDPAALAGIWKGSIGRQPVVACFNRSDAYGAEGSYYYLNCAANYTGEVPFRISLTATGMQFTQWPRGDGCDLDFAADFDALLPYMTSDGRASVKAIMESKK